ncbi:hypothetical protein GCM10010341_53750 [Streptomyces noursei]|nr:hypothetical protein GCM10010341_53750 [Streptomyces noursei]
MSPSHPDRVERLNSRVESGWRAPACRPGAPVSSCFIPPKRSLPGAIGGVPESSGTRQSCPDAVDQSWALCEFCLPFKNLVCAVSEGCAVSFFSTRASVQSKAWRESFKVLPLQCATHCDSLLEKKDAHHHEQHLRH